MESQRSKRVLWDSEDLTLLKEFFILIEDIKEDTNESVKIFDSDQKNLELLNKYLNEERKIYISIFGQYSSGKTSLFNDLIGENIFETNFNLNTNKGILIQNTEEKNFYKLEKIKFVKNEEENYYYFKNCDNNNSIEGKENVIKALKEINKEENKKIEDSFYLITLNIKILKKINENYRNKIIFIDFPGLGVNENLNEKKNFFDTDVFPQLIKQIDCFLFLNKELICDSEFNINFFKRMETKYFLNRPEKSYKNIIFIMSLWDKDSNNKPRTDDDLNEIKKQYEEMLGENNLNIIKYSHRYYEYYKDEKNKLNSYKNYINKSKEEKDECIFNKYYKKYIKNNEEEEEEEEEEENDFKFNKDSFIEFFYNEINKQKKDLIINKDKKYEIKDEEKENFEKNLIEFLKEKQLKNISKFSFDNLTKLFLKYKHNYQLYSKYKINSNYKETFDKIKNLIVKANDNMEEEIRNKFDEFLKIFFDKISFVKNKITQIKKNIKTKTIEDSLNKINNLFINCYAKDFRNIFINYRNLFYKYFEKYNIKENIKKYNNDIKNITLAIQEDLFKLEDKFQSSLEEKYLSIQNIISEEVKIFGLEFPPDRKIKNKPRNLKLKNSFGYMFLRSIKKFLLSDEQLLKNDIIDMLQNLKLDYIIYFQDYENFYKNEIENLRNKIQKHYKELIKINKLEINDLIKIKIDTINLCKQNFGNFLNNKYRTTIDYYN